MTALDYLEIIQRLCEKTGSAGKSATQPPKEVGAAAKPTGKPVLDIYVTEEFVDAAEPSEAWARAFSGDEEQLVLQPVERDLATVVLSVNEEKRATFTLNHPTSVQHGVQTLPGPCFPSMPPSASLIIHVLIALSHWSWHLRRMPDSRPFQKDIDLEFYKLRFTDHYTKEGDAIFEPNSPNLNESGEFDFVARLDDLYGLRIVNRSAQDLYARLFIFSPTSLDICEKSLLKIGPASSVPTIPKNGHLTIGYGSGGQSPFMFLVDPPMECDITIFKLFVSNTPAEFQSLEQQGPFGSGRVHISSNEIQDPVDEGYLWDAFTFTLIQRQDSKGNE
ncbi:unnamed protein product [Rhizoctonia solani]|uniref:Uncharacterized protein n=1 Tax=Rhizoctonia solani TaxID=456999 RepID=A0A8H3C933_9AGAM|nr:unnamed protein product [Rhizoctonia solani]CAE7124597.1 unnamed protein product [Rhizoctonia solani]